MGISADLRRLNQVFDALVEEKIPATMTARQAEILNCVNNHGPCTQTTLVDHTSIDRSTMAIVVERMVNAGLLSRSRAPHDARAWLVSVGPSGKPIMAAVRKAIRAAEREIEGRVASVSSIQQAA